MASVLLSNEYAIGCDIRHCGAKQPCLAAVCDEGALLVYNGKVSLKTNMLEINVSQMLKGPIGTEKIAPVSGSVDITGYGKNAVEGKVKLTRTNRSILVKGTLQTCVQISCARCLEGFACPLTLNIEEEYFPMTDVNTGVPLPEPDEPGSFVIDEHLILDLSEAVRQYALLAVPMKPLCQPDCPGISGY